MTASPLKPNSPPRPSEADSPQRRDLKPVSLKTASLALLTVALWGANPAAVSYSVAVAPLDLNGLELDARKDADLGFSFDDAELQARVVANMSGMFAASAVIAVLLPRS